MTANTLALISSSPFTGTGTQTLNLPTAGNYVIGVNVTLPWLTPDAPVAVANPPVAEVQTITTAADSSGSLNSTFWTFYNAGNITGYYVWYNINSAGVDPAPAGLTGIQVTGATGASASTLGGATRTAIAAALTSGNYPIVSGTTTHIILTNAQVGSCTAAADGTAATGFTFAVGTTGSYGYASGLEIVIKKNSTVLMTLSQPSPNQPLMGGSVKTAITANDVVTVVLSSLAAADAQLNAIKGVVDIYQGF